MSVLLRWSCAVDGVAGVGVAVEVRAEVGAVVVGMAVHQAIGSCRKSDVVEWSPVVRLASAGFVMGVEMLHAAEDDGTGGGKVGAGENEYVAGVNDEVQDAAVIDWQDVVCCVGDGADLLNGVGSEAGAGRVLILWWSRSNSPPAAQHPFGGAHGVRARGWTGASFSDARHALATLARKRVLTAARHRDEARSPPASGGYCAGTAAHH